MAHQRDVVQNPSLFSNQHLHYPPQLYADPVTALYNRQHVPSQPPNSVQTQQYYIPDVTSLALQQMQLQSMFHFRPPSRAPASARVPAVPEAQMASAYRIGRYTPAERRIRLERYREKRAQRNYNRRVKYDCRKQIADKRRRVQGRFVKREQEIALARSENVNASDDTKIHHDSNTDSISSVRQPGNVDQQSFCEHSDQIMESFR